MSGTKINPIARGEHVEREEEERIGTTTNHRGSWDPPTMLSPPLPHLCVCSLSLSLSLSLSPLSSALFISPSQLCSLSLLCFVHSLFAFFFSFLSVSSIHVLLNHTSQTTLRLSVHSCLVCIVVCFKVTSKTKTSPTLTRTHAYIPHTSVFFFRQHQFIPLLQWIERRQLKATTSVLQRNRNSFEDPKKKTCLSPASS